MRHVAMNGIQTAALTLALCRIAWAAPGTTRKWDELRSSNVVPSKISTLPLSAKDAVGLGGLFGVFGFGTNWLQIEGLDNPRAFASNNFAFEHLAYPHEWAASMPPSGVSLRVGHSCHCALSGVAAYAKSDQTAWLRLHFEQCQGCESTAGRAAVVVGLQPSAGLDSNLFAWLCAVRPHSACDSLALPTGKPAKTMPKVPHQGHEAVKETDADEKTKSTTSSTLAPKTSTTLAAGESCSFLGAKTSSTGLGVGKCKGEHVKERQAASLTACEMACNFLYIWQEQHYLGGVKDLNAHVAEINKKPEVCKGYAFNQKDQTCAIYTGNSIAEADGAEDWVCYGDMYVEDHGYEYHFDYTSPECTTTPHPIATTTTATTTSTTVTTTITSTSTTRTTTTTTQTALVEGLSLMTLFDTQSDDARVYGFPGGVHFERDGMEATMMQLQSPCFEDVDYYMLGGTLPVLESNWDHLVHLLNSFGEPTAWSHVGAKCTASATVDRVPVDVAVSRHGDYGQINTVGKALCTILSVAAVSFFSTSGVMYARHAYFSSVAGAATGFTAVLVAATAAGVTFAVTYLSELTICWIAGRVATKTLAMHGSAAMLLISPMLSKLCLPVAGTAAGVAAVIFLWPTSQKRSAPSYKKHDLLIAYDPIQGEFRSVLS